MAKSKLFLFDMAASVWFLWPLKGFNRGGLVLSNKGFKEIAHRRFDRKIHRKLSEKQVKQINKTCLKLFPQKPEIASEPVRRKTWSCRFWPWSCLSCSSCACVSEWFICNLRIHRRSFREVLLRCLTCFLDSCRSN